MPSSRPQQPPDGDVPSSHPAQGWAGTEELSPGSTARAGAHSGNEAVGQSAAGLLFEWLQFLGQTL